MNHAIDLDQLEARCCDLESGHPIEGVLQAHDIPEGWSAYEVVYRYRRWLQWAEVATSDVFRKAYGVRVEKLAPVVEAIAEALGDETR